MSTPNEFPGPEQPGSQPSPDGYGSTPEANAPPANPGQPADGGGATQPPSNQPPYQQPGYQQAPPPHQQQGYQQPGYQQPGYQQQGGAPAESFTFEMPQDMPRSVREVMPAGGLGGMFKMDGLPQLVKISYILWLVSAAIWTLTTLVLFIGSLVAMASKDTFFGYGAALRAAGARGLVVSLISFVLIVAIVICAMKYKEGLQWARMALTAIALLSIILMFFGGGGGVLGVIAVILMWLPESTTWLNSRAGSARS